MSHISHFLLEWKNKSLLIAVHSKSIQMLTEISGFSESRILTHKKLVFCLILPPGRGDMSMGFEQVQSRGNKITSMSSFVLFSACQHRLSAFSITCIGGYFVLQSHSRDMFLSKGQRQPHLSGLWVHSGHTRVGSQNKETAEC